MSPSVSHLRRGVLRGLMLRQPLILEHVHQRRLAGIVQPLSYNPQQHHSSSASPFSVVFSRAEARAVRGGEAHNGCTLDVVRWAAQHGARGGTRPPTLKKGARVFILQAPCQPPHPASARTFARGPIEYLKPLGDTSQPPNARPQKDSNEATGRCRGMNACHRSIALG